MRLDPVIISYSAYENNFIGAIENVRKISAALEKGLLIRNRLNMR